MLRCLILVAVLAFLVILMPVSDAFGCGGGMDMSSMGMGMESMDSSMNYGYMNNDNMNHNQNYQYQNYSPQNHQYVPPQNDQNYRSSVPQGNQGLGHSH